MKCPHCSETKLVMSERNGIEIDYCPDCRGIWLDRGELDKILEKSRETERSEKPQEVRYQQPHPTEYHHGKPYKRKKSFLEEIFD